MIMVVVPEQVLREILRKIKEIRKVLRGEQIE